MKKYLTLIIGTIILIAVIAAGYFLWQRLNLSAILFGPEAPPAAPLPEKLKSLTANPIFDYWLNKKTDSIYYLTETGQIVKYSNGVSEIANSQTINKLNQITASPDGIYAVVKFNYPTLPSFSIFNTVTNGWQPLPENLISAAWSPNSQEILYLDNKGLKIFNVITSKLKEVMRLSQKDVVLDWLLPDTALLSQTASINLFSTLWSINLNKKTIIPLIQNEGGLLVKWSDDGKFGIKFHTKERKPHTSLINENGETLATFNFITLPSKCLIKTNQIYCAGPKNIKEGLELPDDYYKKAVYFDDNIYLIDLAEGSSKVLLENSEVLIDAEHLELFNNMLLFKNRIDGKLYSLTL